MPQGNFFAICLFSLVAGGTAVGARLPTDVMPAPAGVRVSGGRVPMGGILVVTTEGTGGQRLAGAIARFSHRWLMRTWPAGGGGMPAPYKVFVACERVGDAIPSEIEDESYTLTVDALRAEVRAPTDLGAMHGLQTLSQLLSQDNGGWFLPIVTINDRPRFPWRGLMIDVARRWQPIEVIERELDAMEVVKLNVLHLHLTDDQGFRVESLTHPELQAKGSDGLFFTQEQIRSIIAYAAARGIRVVPEFDIPGHATSWVVSHPELASLPGPYGIERQWGVFNPVLDPTNEATYALLADFLGEMSALFPDKYIHIGGDENNGIQWNANPKIQAFIRDHGLRDNEGLHAYFNKRIAALLAKDGKRLVGWDEIASPELPRDCVIDSWRGADALASSAAFGFDGILSNGFYIDLCYPASDHYASDPIPASSTLTADQRKHVLGGEATMWAEWVSPETIDSRIWPRTAAIAERLWSPADVRDVPEMYRRLAIVGARLDEAGTLQDRNKGVMLRHLVGENLGIPGMESLKTLIRVVEPVKHYARGQEQVWENQLVPLVYLADAAQPESEDSREFADRVDALLFSPGALDVATANSVASSMFIWDVAGNEVAETLAADFAALREAKIPAKALVDACAVGGRAVSALLSGKPLTADKLASDLTVLDRCGEPNGAAVMLPVLAPIRLLVVAAAKQANRSGLSPEEWRQLIHSTAFPAEAPLPVK
jgi:hexosaminidase